MTRAGYGVKAVTIRGGPGYDGFCFASGKSVVAAQRGWLVVVVGFQEAFRGLRSSLKRREGEAAFDEGVCAGTGWGDLGHFEAPG